MKITLDENYNAKTDTTTLGYVGETNSRIITFEGYQCDGADSYKMRFKYADGVTYDVDISDGTYTIDGSILRCVGTVHAQILACKQNGDSYEYVKKSDILTLQIGRSLNGNIASVPPYEQSVGALEKFIAVSKKVDEITESVDEAITTANTAKSDLQTENVTASENIAKLAEENANADETLGDINNAIDDLLGRRNLLPNSSFDDGLTGYTTSNLNGGTAEIADGYNGHNGVILTRHNCTNSSRCSISSTPNITTYKSGDMFTLSAWIKVNEPLAEFYLGELRITKSSGVFQLVLSRTNVTVGDWIYYTNTFTATDNGKFTGFSVMLHNNGSFTVSDISFTKSAVVATSAELNALKTEIEELKKLIGGNNNE